VNIYKFEFKTYWKSFTLWSLGIIALQIIMMIFYPTMARDAQMMDLIMENYPEELLQAMGLGEHVSLATVLGYYTFVFVFVQLLIGVQSAYYGCHFLSIEEREHTADFLFAKPVTRRRILIEKYLAAFTILLLTSLVVTASTFISIELFSDGREYEIGPLILLLFTVPIFQLFFFSIGMLVTVGTKRIRSVISYALGFGFGLYVLNAFRSIVGGEFLGFFTPYYHFEPSYILMEGSIPVGRAIISISMILLAHGITYFAYLKRNIRAQ